MPRNHPGRRIRRPADRPFFRSAVNINAAAEGVRVFRLKSLEPNDARDHRIAARSIRFENFAGESPVAKDGADRRVIADPFQHTAALVAVLKERAAGVPVPRAHIPARGTGRPAAAAAH